MSDKEGEGPPEVTRRDKRLQLHHQSLSQQHSNQPPKQQQVGTQAIANLKGKKEKKNRDSLSKRAQTASRAVKIIQCVNL